MFGCYIYMYIVSDQGIFQLGAKLYAEESFLLGIDWSLLYSRHEALNKNKVHRHLVFLSRYTDACGGHFLQIYMFPLESFVCLCVTGNL